MAALALELHSETHSHILVAGTCRPLSSVPFLGKTCRWSCSEEADDSTLAARCDDILPPSCGTYLFLCADCCGVAIVVKVDEIDGKIHECTSSDACQTTVRQSRLALGSPTPA
jgi:hypothetical protein